MDAVPERLRAKWDHRWSQRRLSGYVDDELRPVERRRLERHADVCPECGPLLRALAGTVFRLRQLRLREVSPVAAKVIERLRVEEAWR